MLMFGGKLLIKSRNLSGVRSIFGRGEAVKDEHHLGRPSMFMKNVCLKTNSQQSFFLSFEKLE